MLPQPASQGNTLLRWDAARHPFAPAPCLAPGAAWSGFPPLQPARKVLDVATDTNDKRRYIFHK